jgi:hypothetical protein
MTALLWTRLPFLVLLVALVVSFAWTAWQTEDSQ